MAIHTKSHYQRTIQEVNMTDPKQPIIIVEQEDDGGYDE